MRLAIDRAMGIDTIPEDVVAEWETGQESEKRIKIRPAVDRLRDEHKDEPRRQDPNRALKFL